MKNVTLYTDGSCIDNQNGGGRGGYCAILTIGEHERVISGALKNTTNNQAELTAVIQGLSALKYPCAVKIVTDSRYVKEGSTDWALKWRRNGWISSDGKPVANKELWMQLLDALSRHQVTWEWIRGHTGHPFNERCDEISQKEARKL